MPTDAAPAPEYEDIVHVTVRGGISDDYSLNFADSGGRRSVPCCGAVPRGGRRGGVRREAYAAAAIQLATGDYYVWEQIVPISAGGGVYEFLTGPVQPYGGADRSSPPTTTTARAATSPSGRGSAAGSTSW